jgi:uncharacterized delta-60 repeat protein
MVLTLQAAPQSGGIDPSFNPTYMGSFGVNAGVYGTVSSIVVQPDGKILIGGDFSSFNGISRNHIARVNTDGSLDESFNPGTGADNFINSVALQPDGKILIGGGFTSYNGTSRNRISRLNANGSLDDTFNPGSGADNWVNSISVQTDGKILVAGKFTSFNGLSVYRIVRLQADGSSDGTFGTSVGFDNSVNTLVLQTDGKVLVSGDFTNFYTTSRRYIARLKTDGSLDETFNPGSGADSYVNTLALQADGKVLLGGYFSAFNGTSRNRIARLHTGGNLDFSFNPGSGSINMVSSIAVQNDGRVLVVGDFDLINDVARDNIARLNATGSLDASFDPGTGTPTPVYRVVLQPDGKALIGGAFTSYNGTGRNGLARILTNDFAWNGSVSNDWATAANWTPSGVPSSSHSVEIPSTSSGIPTLTGPVSLSSLYVRSGKTLGMGSHTITLAGSLGNDGTVTSSTGKLSMAGSSLQSISGSGTLSNLEINNTSGVTIAIGTGNMQSLTGVLTLTSGTLATNGNLTLKSDASGTARVAALGATASVSGEVTVERYIPPGRKWRLLGAPLTGNADNSVFANWQNNGTELAAAGVEIWGPGGSSNPSAGNGLKSGPNPSMRSYANNAWSAVTDTKSSLLFDGTTNKAYALFATGPFRNGGSAISVAQAAEATTLSATGTLITGDHTKTLSATFGHYYLVANPYASPVNPASFTGSNITNLAPTLYMWDAKVGGDFGLGKYVAYDITNNVYAPSGSGTGYETGTQIQSGQAFFVRATATGTATLKFLETSKGTLSTNNMMGNSVQSTRRSVRIQLEQGGLAVDGAVAFFHEGASASLDAMDGIKMPNSNDNLGLRSKGRTLVFEHRPLPTMNDTLQIVLSQMQRRTHSLCIAVTGIEAREGYLLELLDRHTQQRYELSLSDTAKLDFTVDADESSTGERFLIVMSKSASTSGSAVEPSTPATRQHPYPNPLTGSAPLQVDLDPARVPWGVRLTDLSGRTLWYRKVSDPSQVRVEIDMSRFASGVYQLEMSDGRGNREVSQVLKQ